MSQGPDNLTGVSLIIPSRHPVQVYLAVGFLLAAGFQINQGPTPQLLKLGVDTSLWYTQAAVMGIGSFLLLLSAVLAVKRPWESIGCSLAGVIMMSATMWYYVYLTWNFNPGHHPWAMAGFWFFSALSIGFMHRAIQLIRGANRIIRVAKQ